MGSTVDSVWSSNDHPPFWALAPPPPAPERRFCCPYCPEGPQRGRFRSHLRRHYRAAVRGMVRGGLAPRAPFAVLRAAPFRDSREARRRIRRDRRRRLNRGMMVAALSPNHAFWAAHRLRGTHPRGDRFPRSRSRCPAGGGDAGFAGRSAGGGGGGGGDIVWRRRCFRECACACAGGCARGG
ncbi:hypothetical protein OsJ_08145 [Oryza sativa Japonica Group]|uniref:Uncharacterized protein n=1 Tax=Oryza sativa subsp. japonica TaxID=39947 RepID=A3AAQ2_ORYSJ|nr:hypothetical protein OsJ_08145 [Oryza sativa Japonica Group]